MTARQIKRLYLCCEWLIDFLTVRQYETNVVGLKSAESWVDDIIRLARDHKIICIFDNDEAGRKTMEKLASIKYRYFNRSCDESISHMKDFNDLHGMWGELTLDFVNENLLSDTPIMRTIDKFRERQKILRERWKLGIDWPYEDIQRDKLSCCMKGIYYWRFL